MHNNKSIFTFKIFVLYIWLNITYLVDIKDRKKNYKNI